MKAVIFPLKSDFHEGQFVEFPETEGNVRRGVAGLMGYVKHYNDVLGLLIRIPGHVVTMPDGRELNAYAYYFAHDIQVLPLKEVSNHGNRSDE